MRVVNILIRIIEEKLLNFFLYKYKNIIAETMEESFPFYILLINVNKPSITKESMIQNV